MEEKKHKTAKKVVAGAAGVVTAAGLLVNTVVTDPATLLKPADGSAVDPSHVCVVDDVEHRRYVVETDEYEPYTLRERICLRIQSLPLPVRALVLLPLWGIGEVLTVLLSALWSSPVGQFLLHFLLEIALLVGLFALVWKLLFPHVPLRKVFSKKTFPWLIVGALLIAAADALLAYYWEPWKVWRIVLLAAVGFGVLLLLYHRIMDKLPLPKARKRKVELVVE
ncbi:MAG: hypothetical protein IKZ44_10905 [Clostridia bacterium]|nr:hypothetical protein [Clostridia bacterium]